MAKFMNKIVLPLILVVFFSLFSIIGYADTGFTSASAFGVKEIKSLELLINTTPVYLANTNLSFLFVFRKSDFQDGISKFVDVKFKIVLDRTTAQSSTANLLINGTACLNSPYNVQLPVGQYVSYFDCTNRFNASIFTGDFNIVYNITYNVNRNRENIVFLFYPTYVNNPDFSEINNMISDIQLILAKVYEDNILHNNDFCILPNTSRKQLTIFSGNSTQNTTTTKNIDTFCNLGCDNNTGKCALSQFDSGIIALIIILVLIGVGFWFMKQRL